LAVILSFVIYLSIESILEKGQPFSQSFSRDRKDKRDKRDVRDVRDIVV
jgi:hypothetical protein